MFCLDVFGCKKYWNKLCIYTCITINTWNCIRITRLKDDIELFLLNILKINLYKLFYEKLKDMQVIKWKVWESFEQLTLLYNSSVKIIFFRFYTTFLYHVFILENCLKVEVNIQLQTIFLISDFDKHVINWSLSIYRGSIEVAHVAM